eukprot:gnl/MRDRNA2_/MRDRNA2_76203_c0_seq1.p1 gnl/MRDRNA2_/MRDRNA2_76203_c0~~gnl/MRDRNA2_/MRDRNA2_76203_c0_seq1.p1  ORF type:complete len:277 (-),score=63.27 gnl/MRDRNA2_/MRDRNA2_76203_c0_seq1:19-849(-)
MESDGKERLLDARQAFKEQDAEASKQYHDARDQNLEGMQPHKEPTLPTGKFVRPAVFGGLDGLSTMFALVAGAYGAELGEVHTIALGTAQLVAGAVSMGAGEYLSSKADNEVAIREESRERWEVENYPEGEIVEMIEIYKAKGMTAEDASIVANTLSKYTDFWVEHMMLTEIGMLPPEAEGVVLNGVLMFLSFLIFGAVPLVAYVGALALGAGFNEAFMYTCILSCVGLFALGAIKAMIADLQIVRGGITMLFQGAFAGALSYSIGLGIPKLFKAD